VNLQDDKRDSVSLDASVNGDLHCVRFRCILITVMKDVCAGGI
jgi:hypothetical protein